MPGRTPEEVVLTIPETGKIFRKLSGIYLVSAKILKSLLDEATDDSNGSYNSYLFSNVRKEAESIYKDEGRGDVNDWEHAKKHLSGRLFSCFWDFPEKLGEYPERELDFLHRFRKAVENTTPRGSDEPAGKALEYIIHHLPT